MTTPEPTVVYGWKRAAAIVGCSERYLRDLVAERDLIAERRADQAVGLKLVDLEALATELRSGTSGQRPAVRESVPGPDGGGDASPSAEVPLPAPSIAQGLPEQRAVGHAPESILPAPASTSAAVRDQGALAAAIFRALEGGQTMRQIVISQQVTPEIAREMHARWTSLAAADALTAEPAEAHLARLDGELKVMQAKIDRGEAAALEHHAHLLHRIEVLEEREAALERRVSAAGLNILVRNLLQRLGAVETQLHRQPAALMPIGRRCGNCGQGPLVSPVACTGCGFGTGAAG
jgi:hypothetical protein